MQTLLFLWPHARLRLLVGMASIHVRSRGSGGKWFEFGQRALVELSSYRKLVDQVRAMGLSPTERKHYFQQTGVQARDENPEKVRIVVYRSRAEALSLGKSRVVETFEEGAAVCGDDLVKILQGTSVCVSDLLRWLLHTATISDDSLVHQIRGQAEMMLAHEMDPMCHPRHQVNPETDEFGKKLDKEFSALRGLIRDLMQ